MDNTAKEYAIAQLIDMAMSFQNELVNVRYNPKDGDLDQEYKAGAREAFLLVNKSIQKRVAEIESEIEQK